jgi:short subunit dehydrogenase-like uncharacterized protein
VYILVTGQIVSAARLSKQLRWLVGWGPMQRLLKRAAGRMSGPAASARAQQAVYAWGEAENAAGMRTANGYDVTVHGSPVVAQCVLERDGNGGTFTPSMLMGRTLVEQLPGSATIQMSSHECKSADRFEIGPQPS